MVMGNKIIMYYCPYCGTHQHFKFTKEEYENAGIFWLSLECVKCSGKFHVGKRD